MGFQEVTVPQQPSRNRPYLGFICLPLGESGAFGTIVQWWDFVSDAITEWTKAGHGDAIGAPLIKSI